MAPSTTRFSILLIVLVTSGYFSLALALAAADATTGARPPQYPRPIEDPPHYPFVRLLQMDKEDVLFFSEHMVLEARQAMLDLIKQHTARGQLVAHSDQVNQQNNVLNRLIEQHMVIKRGERGADGPFYVEMDGPMMDMALGWRAPFVQTLQAALIAIQQRRDSPTANITERAHPTIVLKIGRWPRAVEQFGNRKLSDRIESSIEGLQQAGISGQLILYARVLLAKLLNPAALQYTDCDRNTDPQCTCACECVQIEVDADMIQVWLDVNRASLIERMDRARHTLAAPNSVYDDDRLQVVQDPSKYTDKDKEPEATEVQVTTISLDIDCSGPARAMPGESPATMSSADRAAVNKHMAHLRRDVMGALRTYKVENGRAVMRRILREERVFHRSQFEAELGIVELWPSDQDGLREYRSLTNPQRVWQRLNCMEINGGPLRQSSPLFFHYFDHDEQGHSKWACFKGYDDVPMPLVTINYAAAPKADERGPACSYYQIGHLCNMFP